MGLGGGVKKQVARARYIPTLNYPLLVKGAWAEEKKRELSGILWRPNHFCVTRSEALLIDARYRICTMRIVFLKPQFRSQKQSRRKQKR